MRALNRQWMIPALLAMTLAAGCVQLREDRSPTYRVVGWKYQIEVVDKSPTESERLIAGIIVDQDMKAENFKLEISFGLPGYEIVPVDTLVAQAYRDSILAVMLANGNYNPAQHAPPVFYQTTGLVGDGAAGMRVTFDVWDVSADLHGIDPGDSVGFGGTTQTDLDDGGGLTSYGSEIHPVVLLPETAGLSEFLPNRRPGLQISGISPNPMRGQATVAYTLPQAAMVNLDVFDIAGRLVARLANGYQPAGDHQVIWDGRDQRSIAVPAGVYFARLDTPQGSVAQRIVIAD